MKTAFAYHRYSSELQKDSYTLETQRSVTKDIAKKHETRIIQVYEDEAISGATIEKRPSMLQLLEDLPKLKPDYLISTDQDRIARGNDFWIIKNTLVKSKTSIITEKEGLIDFSDITKDALSDMIAVFAKLERKMIGRRISRAAAQKMKKGLYYGGKPIGYYMKDGRIYINEIEARQIKKIFELALKNIGMSRIAFELDRLGIKTPKGNRYCITTISRILTSPLYTGKIKVEGSYIKAKHKAIISEATFKKANDLLKIRKLKSRTRPNKYLLSGFLICGKCGRKMHGGKQYYVYYKNGKVVNTRYGYRCGGIAYRECGNGIIGKVEEYIFADIAGKIKKLKLNLEEGLAFFIKKNTPGKKVGVEAEIADIDTKMSKLLDGYLENIIDIETYKKRNNQLKYAKEQLTKEISTFTKDNLADKVYNYVRDFDIDNLYTDLDFEAKRELLDIFVRKIEIGKSGGMGKRDYKKRYKIHWKI